MGGKVDLFRYLCRRALLGWCGHSLDLKDCARQLTRLSLHCGTNAHGGQGAAEDAAGKPEELFLRVSSSVPFAS